MQSNLLDPLKEKEREYTTNKDTILLSWRNFQTQEFSYICTYILLNY